jgi:hypothetical protein
MIVVPDYRRRGPNVTTLSQDKPHVETVTCLKLTADHAERAGAVRAKRWIDRYERFGGPAMTIGSLAMKTLAAILVLFTLASSASAECAWMVWIATSGAPTEWMAQAAFTSQQPCMSEARRLARVELHAPDEALDDPVGS